MGADDARTAELAAALAAVRARIDAAARAAGRDPADLALVAVSKTRPAEDVAAFVDLGLRDFGENRDQEARPKATAVEVLRPAAEPPVRWHFVGRLQRNKARSVAAYADWVHSVDRPELVDPLERAAESYGRTLTVLLQVALDDAPGRGGADPAEVQALADLVGRSSHLRLGGVMAVAPLGVPPRPAFDRLQDVAESLQKRHPGAVAISAGMSGDLEEAVAAGATHLRVGAAMFGVRPPLS